MVTTFINTLLNFGAVEPPDPFTGPRLSSFESDMQTFLAKALILLGCLSALSRTVDLFKLLSSLISRLVFGKIYSRPRSVSQLFLVRLMGFLLLLPLLVSSLSSIWLILASSYPEVARVERIAVQLVKFAVYGRGAVYPYGGAVHRFDPAEGRIKGIMHALYADIQCLVSQDDICMIGDERNMGWLANFILSNDSESIFQRSASTASFIYKTVTEKYANVSTWWMLVRYVSAQGHSAMANFSTFREEFWNMAARNDRVNFNSDTMVNSTHALLGCASNSMLFINSSLVPYLVQCAYFVRPRLAATLNFIIGATSSASVYGITTVQSTLIAVHQRVSSAASVNPFLELNVLAKVPRVFWSDTLKSLFMVTGMLMAIAFRHYRRGTLKHMITLLEPENVNIIMRLFQECNELSVERDALLRERNNLVNKRRAFSRKHDDLYDERNALFNKCEQLQSLLSEARSAHCKAAIDYANMTSNIQDVARKLVRASDDMVDQAKENEAQMFLLNREVSEAKFQRKKTTILYKIAHSKAVSLSRKFKNQQKLLVVKRKTIRGIQRAAKSSTYEAEATAIQATDLVMVNKLLRDAFGLLYSGALSYMPDEELFKIESLIMASIELYASDEIYASPEPLSPSHFDTSVGVNASTDDDTLADTSCQLKSVGPAAAPHIDTLSPPPRAPASPLLQPPSEIHSSPLPLLEGTPVPWHPSMAPKTPTPSMLPRYVLRGASTSTPVHVFKGRIKSRVTDSTRKTLAKSKAQEDKENVPLCSV